MNTSTSFLDNLEWRRAVKHFGTGDVDIECIIRAMTNAPSSFGLQPYKIVVVQNKELKEELQNEVANFISKGTNIMKEWADCSLVRFTSLQVSQDSSRES